MQPFEVGDLGSKVTQSCLPEDASGERRIGNIVVGMVGALVAPGGYFRIFGRSPASSAPSSTRRLAPIIVLFVVSLIKRA